MDILRREFYRLNVRAGIWFLKLFTDYSGEVPEFGEESDGSRRDSAQSVQGAIATWSQVAAAFNAGYCYLPLQSVGSQSGLRRKLRPGHYRSRYRMERLRARYRTLHMTWSPRN